jgi:hypothetical protein
MPAPQDRSLVGAILAAGPGREAGARHPGFFDDAGDGLDHSTVLDCTPELAAEIEDCLKTAMAKGVVRYGAHRQDAAMMTCFTPVAGESEPRSLHRWRTGRLRAGRDRTQGKQRARVIVSL